MSTPDWLEPWKDRLRALWPTGMSTPQMGRVLTKEFDREFTKNAVVGKARRLGLEARPSPILVAGHPKTTPLTDEQRDSIRCLAEQGKSDDVIAAAHGIGPWTVRRLLKRQDASGLRRDRIRALGAIKATLPPPTPRPAIQPPPPRPVIVLPLSGTSGPCCFPLGEPGTKAFRYCDDPSVRGKPYCADHVRLCYVAKPRAVEPKEFTFGWSSPA